MGTFGALVLPGCVSCPKRFAMPRLALSQGEEAREPAFNTAQRRKLDERRKQRAAAEMHELRLVGFARMGPC